ncbi:MAG: DsbA family oxidoreductase, partial [Bacteroidota bacterium]
LAIRKGWSLEHAAKLNRQVSDTAAAAGLQFNLEKAVPANSFDAHRLSKLAEEKGLGNELEEKLFEAYFTKGLNIQNAETLAEIAVQAGLSKEESAKLNNPESYAAQVLAEIAEARELGISGVPFFVFNRKYAVSGAQPAEVFLQVLQKLDEEETPAFSMEASGETCSTDGVC